MELLGYRDTLPLQWQLASGDELPSAWAEQNVRMLLAVVALGERVMVEPETPGAAEFERLHYKFDLVIELLGALLRQQRAAMPPTPLRLSSAGLSWLLPDDPPPPGTRLDVSIHLHACAPTPLQWRGEVIDHADGELRLRFLEMPEALASALERHVFMHHRRSVAGARSPVQRGDVATAP